VEAGCRAGCRTILIDNGNETEWQVSAQRLPDYVVADLAQAAQVITRGARENIGMNTGLAKLLDTFVGLNVVVIGEAMLGATWSG